jgi:hypothetical protein
MWADFGQGKTHSLLFIQNALAQQSGISILYVQLPPLTSGSPFVALYRQLMRGFPIDTLARRIFDHFQRSPLELFRNGTTSERTIYQLLWLVATQAPGNDSALQWLQGEKVRASDLGSLSIAGRKLSVPGAPTTAQDCQNVLDTLVTIATSFPSGRSDQLVLLVDEFQRIGELSSAKRIETCNALHLLFNRHPQGLRLVLAFAGGLPGVVDSVLTPDLQSRVHSRIDFPSLSKTDAREYLAELLAKYRAVPTDSEELYFPFEPLAVDHLIDLADPENQGLSPRRVNILFDRVTNGVLDDRAADPRGKQTTVSLAEVRKAVDRIGPELRAKLEETE